MATIEEKLSKCILHNLRILTFAVKPSEHLEEVLTEGIFLKSNTQVFIHVTHYLFNILDAKEFKKRFYWPISDKKGESTYRTNAIEFTNHLIEKYGIAQEKIKQVNVVHPTGKRFMSLILALVATAIKEIMKRKNYDTKQSLNLDKALDVAKTINNIETDISNNIKAEMKVIKEKTREIQEVLSKIYPQNETDVPFEDFIVQWHRFNAQRVNIISHRNEKIEKIFEGAKCLHDKAQALLSNKSYEINTPSASVMSDVAAFYDNPDLFVDNKLNISSLGVFLKTSLPVIMNFINNYSYAGCEVSDDEMKIVKQKLSELEKVRPLIEKLVENEQKIKEKIVREDEALPLENSSLQDEIDKSAIEARELEVLDILLPQKYFIDTSKSCMNNTVVKRNHLMFTEGCENVDKENVTAVMNQSIFRPPVSSVKLNQTRTEMGPPKQSLRGRRNAMQLLEKALAPNKNRIDMNSTKITPSAPIASTPVFSSTFLYSDFSHGRPNFSAISDISVITQTPVQKPAILEETENFGSCVVPTIIVNELNASNSESNVTPDTILFRGKIGEEEDLFNISDSVLVDE